MTPTDPAPVSGRRETRGGGDVLVIERVFAAGLDDVWAACTDPVRMQRWIGTWHGDPASGEIAFRMTAEGDDVAEELYDVDVCEPPHRFNVRSRDGQPFGEDDSAAHVHWVMTLELTRIGDATRLVFSQEIAHPDVAASVGPGWEYYLDRLGAAIAPAGLGAVADAVEAVDWAAYQGGSGAYRRLFS